MIYETSGRAREYFELAVNLYSGCQHACRYCYGANVVRKDPKVFFAGGTPRKALGVVLDELERDAVKLMAKYETRHVLLSFVTDPYQPAEADYQLTRRAIEILHNGLLNVAILTKAGALATRDFDLLTKNDCFGVTLTFLDEKRSLEWEPGAALPSRRIANLMDARKCGIQTWVSLEPVIDPVESLALIAMTADFVDVFKVGTLNYVSNLPPELLGQVEGLDWPKFAQDVVHLLDTLGANYYIKRDLAKYIGRPDGLTKGNVPK